MMHPTNWTPRQWTPFNDQTERAQSEQHGACSLYPAVNTLRDDVLSGIRYILPNALYGIVLGSRQKMPKNGYRTQ